MQLSAAWKPDFILAKLLGVAPPLGCRCLPIFGKEAVEEVG